MRWIKLGNIRLAGVIDESYTDGVGVRYTIFTQGCMHQCYNCQNKETWDFNAGTVCSIDKIIEQLKTMPWLDGVTLSGGDPMYRETEVLELVKKIKENTTLNIWLYTGFTYEECLADTAKREILNYIDVLVDGKYEEQLRSLHLKFRGSSNQRIIDIPKSLKENKVVILIDD